MQRTIVSRGILTLGLATAILAVFAGSASAFKTLIPSSVDFGDRQVGTTSPPQAHTLKVTCSFILVPFPFCLSNDTLNPTIGTIGNFAQTNNCPPFMNGNTAAGVSCTINTTFTPLSTGPKSGTLSTGGPTAALTGNGVTIPTPPTPPTGSTPNLTLDLDANKQKLKKKLKLFVEANQDATLIVSGRVKPITKELEGDDRTKIKVKPKKRNKLKNKLEDKGKAKVKVEVEAISQGGDTADDTIKIKLKD